VEVTGRIKDVSKDWKSEKLVISFEVDSIPSDLDDLQTSTRVLHISAKPFHKKRSLNANSYFHVLTGKIAAKLGTSLDHEKNRLIREYGQYEFIDGWIPTVLIDTAFEDQLLDMEGVHWKPVARPDRDHVKMAFLRGSHTYNTAEMARLIDATVEQAKELGIETLTPAELERMKASWTKNK
jgi:hypothetical protein